VTIRSLTILVVAAILLPVPAAGIFPGPAAAGEQSSLLVYSLPFRLRNVRASFPLEIAILNLINRERSTAGLAPLIPHATLRSVARAHGVEMLAFGYLSHLSRDGKTPQQRVLGRGVRARLIGENIAYARDIRAAHDSLMDSEAHRLNILSTNYELVGIGVVDAGPHGVIVVQDFSAPRR